MRLACIVFFLAHIFQNMCNLNGEGKLCGRPLGVPEEKIVAGYDVGYYKYPWYAALMSSNIVACGGSLVASKIIISAAHCFKEYIEHNPKNMQLEDVYNVTLGIYNRCEKEKTQKAFQVAKVHVHEKYKDNIPYYDISILVLKEATDSYEPICLPKNPVKRRPKEGSVPGLGTLRYQGATPCTLHEARLLIYSDNECRKMINRTGNDASKLFKAFCGGYLQGGIDTCQGDSGGPFQIVDKYGNFVLLGLVSFGFHCANPNLLGIYTDVSQYIDWIQEKTGISPTMEPADNSTAPTVVPTEETNFTEYHPPTKKPHYDNPVHVIHHFVRPPVNIIIIGDRKNEKKKVPVQTSSRRKKSSKKKRRKN